MSITATAVWTPRPSDTPRRGNIAVHGHDPEPIDSIPDLIPANRRTLFCRDEAHGECRGTMHDFDFQFLYPTEDPCGCTCHE